MICPNCGEYESFRYNRCPSCGVLQKHPTGPVEAPHRPPPSPVPTPAGLKSPYHSPVNETYVR